MARSSHGSGLALILLGIMAVQSVYAVHPDGELKTARFHTNRQDQEGMMNPTKEQEKELDGMSLKERRAYLHDLELKHRQEKAQNPSNGEELGFVEPSKVGQNTRQNPFKVSPEERQEIFQKKQWKGMAQMSPKERSKMWQERHGAGLTVEPEDIAEGEVEIKSREMRAAVVPAQENEERRERKRGRKAKGALQKVLDTQGLTLKEFKQMSRSERQEKLSRMLPEEMTLEEYKQMSRSDRSELKKEVLRGEERQGKRNQLPAGKKGGKGEKNGKKQRLAGLSDVLEQQIRAIKQDQNLDIAEKKLRINQLIDESPADESPQYPRRRLTGLPDDVLEQIRAIKKDKNLDVAEKKLRINQLIDESTSPAM